MVQTASLMLDLGTSAPDFSLPDADGKIWHLAELAAQKPLLVIFLCNHCPYVIHIRAKLADVTRQFMARGVAVVGINANDADRYPLDSPEKMKEEILLAGYAFPYLYDESQAVAQTYRAACTPDFFLFDRHHRLVYRGQFDGSRPKNTEPVTGKDLVAALEAVLIDAPQIADQYPSLGCNIKWKEGNEPDYS